MNTKEKNILMLTKFGGPATDRYVTEAQKLGSKITLANYPDITMHFYQGRTDVFAKDKNVLDFDVFFFRTMLGFEEMATVLATFLSYHKRSVVDHALASLAWIDRKSFETLKLSLNGLPVIETWLGIGVNVLSQVNMPFPWVIKRTNLNQGKGVYLCDSIEKAREVISHHPTEMYLVQRFIPNQGDLRVFVVGDKVLAAIKRRTTDPKEFRNNASLGGKSEKYKIDSEIEGLAVKAAKCIGYDIVGVDLIYDETAKQWLVMETNRAPQYQALEEATGVDAIQTMVKWLHNLG